MIKTKTREPVEGFACAECLNEIEFCDKCEKRFDCLEEVIYCKDELDHYCCVCGEKKLKSPKDKEKIKQIVGDVV